MIRFLLRRIRRIDKSEWDSCHREILKTALDDEVIMIYREGEYYGHVDMYSPMNIMIPERNFDYEPSELLFDHEVIENAYRMFEKCRNLRLIPVKLRLSVDDMMLFAQYKVPAEDLSVYECALVVMDTYAASERAKERLVNILTNGKRLMVLSELNEFTYKCYRLLENTDIKIRVEGILWSLVGLLRGGGRRYYCHAGADRLCDTGMA